MQRLTRYLAIGSLLAIGLIPALADQTNLVQDISVQLLGLKQGRTTTNGSIVVTGSDVVGVDTRQVIAAVGAATGNTFSNTARLVLVTPVIGGFYSIQIRDGANTVDVSPFFIYEVTGGPVHTSVANLTNGQSTSTDYSIQHFALVDSWVTLNLHLDFRGSAVSTVRSGPAPVRLNQTLIDGEGAGDRNGNLLILRGIISIRGNTIEVVPSIITTS